jgi:hypothetical protein
MGKISEHAKTGARKGASAVGRGTGQAAKDGAAAVGRGTGKLAKKSLESGLEAGRKEGGKREAP